MFFQGWSSVGTAVLICVLAYPCLILMLRVSGKRTQAKMNAFDLVVTVAIGSILATIILSRDVPLAEGLAAMASLIFLQFVATWLSVRSVAICHLIRGEPTLLFYRGSFLQAALKRERVTESEIYQAIREQGSAQVSSLAVVLETNGTFSVLSPGENGPSAALTDVQCPPPVGAAGSEAGRVAH